MVQERKCLNDTLHDWIEKASVPEVIKTFHTWYNRPKSLDFALSCKFGKVVGFYIQGRSFAFAPFLGDVLIHWFGWDNHLLVLSRVNYSNSTRFLRLCESENLSIHTGGAWLTTSIPLIRSIPCLIATDSYCSPVLWQRKQLQKVNKEQILEWEFSPQAKRFDLGTQWMFGHRISVFSCVRITKYASSALEANKKVSICCGFLSCENCFRNHNTQYWIFSSFFRWVLHIPGQIENWDEQSFTWQAGLNFPSLRAWKNLRQFCRLT